tara:strand:+ start:2554 stop:3561 length:1008 start_codon:yes stop_codon:yes gene_type:complete
MDWIDEFCFPPAWQTKLCFPPGTLPVNVIRQSFINSWRFCGMKAKLSQEVEGYKRSANLFVGSVIHVAVDDCATAIDTNHWLATTHDPRYWDDIFQQVFLVNPKHTFRDDLDYPRLCSNLVSPIFDGSTIGQIIFFAIQIIKASGFEFRGSEVNIGLDIPGGIPYSGTLDLLLWHKQFGLVIGDTKTSGIITKLLGTGSLQKQSYSKQQVAHHLQLTHYGWMGWRAGMWSPEEIGQHMIFTPVNLTKYTRGPKKGTFRGEPFHFGTPVPKNIQRYEEDIVMWLNMMKDGLFPRMYPGVYGKLDCPRCPFVGDCLEDKSSGVVPDYIKVAAGASAK